jgi:Spy/CpxP family protein refolding chaperone
MKRFLRLGSLSVLAVAAMATVALAQPDRGDRRQGFGDTAGLLLLGNEAVVKELELVEDQQTKLRELGEKQRDEIRAMFEGMRDLPDDERRAAFEGMREKIEEQAKKVQDEVNNILLPNQVARLKQIQFQQSARGFGGRGGVTSGRVAEALGISEEQREQLRAKAEEIRAETDKKIAEIRKDAEKQLLQVLTPEQRAKYDELMGEPFELPQGGFFQRGQGGGGREGNREGGRRGRGERRPEGDGGNDRPDA